MIQGYNEELIQPFGRLEVLVCGGVALYCFILTDVFLFFLTNTPLCMMQFNIPTASNDQTPLSR